MTLLKELRKSTYLGHPEAHQTEKPILEVSGLSVRYETGMALEDISFHLNVGERIAVVGPNGAGKSTLFKVIAGVLNPSAGEVTVFGQGPDGHLCIAYVPQRSQVDWNFPVSVKDVVMMGRIGKLGLFHWPKSQDWDYVSQCLEVVGMAPLADRQISELSGGQQQRMFVARALAQQAELMLMDEPLNGLDIQSQENIFEIMDELRKRGVTVMISTHDLDQAANRFDRVLLLNHRLIGFGRPADVFHPELLLEAYGGRLHMVQNEREFTAVGDTCCNEEGES